MKNLIGLVASFLFIFLVILSAKLIEKKGKEASRKYIHILLCNWWFIAMYFFENAIVASMIPFLFIIINYISYKKDLIQVMERENNKEEGLGTVYYAISLWLLSIVSFGILKNPRIGLVGVLVMGYGDGLAAIIGKSIASKSYHIGKTTTKTIAGSLTMFCITFFILSLFLWGSPFWLLKVLGISMVVTVIEAISIKGTDNLTVPVLTSILYYIVLGII